MNDKKKKQPQGIVVPFKKTSKEVRKQYGNYIVRITDEAIKISAVSHIWSMEISILNPNFVLLVPLFDDKKADQYLESFFTLNFLLGNMMIDKGFMEDFIKIYNDRVNRMRDERKDIVSEEGS